MFDLSAWLLNSSKTVSNKSYTSLEGNPNICGQLTFNKEAKTIQRRKEESFQQMVLGQLDFPHDKEGSGTPFLTPYAKINLKWIKDLNRRA